MAARIKSTETINAEVINQVLNICPQEPASQAKRRPPSKVRGGSERNVKATPRGPWQGLPSNAPIVATEGCPVRQQLFVQLAPWQAESGCPWLHHPPVTYTQACRLVESETTPTRPARTGFWTRTRARTRSNSHYCEACPFRQCEDPSRPEC